MKWKEILNNVFKVFIFIFLLCFFVAFHEFGHCIAAQLTGSECLGYGINWEEMSAYTRVIPKDKLSWYTILVAGTGFGISLSIIVCIIGKTIKRYELTYASYIYILNELFYWLLSPIQKRGDAYMLFQAMNFTDFVTYYIIMSAIIIDIIINFLLFIKKHIDEVIEKWDSKME